MNDGHEQAVPSGSETTEEVPWETVWQVLKKEHVGPPYASAIPLRGAEENEDTQPHKIPGIHLQSGVVPNDQQTDTTQCPSADE